MEKYYYLYKITNILNGKIYVGVHETFDLNDGYFGSGKLIITAIKKYGKSNFHKEILEFFPSKNEMYEAEAFFINEEFAKDRNTYNIVVGGSGGSIFLNRKPFVGPHTETTKEILSEKGKLRKVSNETKQKISNFMKVQRNLPEWKTFFGQISRYNKSEGQKNKIRQTLLGKKHDKIKCIYCNKEVGERTVNRFHNENCKLKHARMV